MSTPRHIWWQYAKGMIRQYPRIKDADNLPAHKAAERDAVRRAVEETGAMPDGVFRMRLIRLLYWDRKWHTLEDAAPEAYTSVGTARNWHREFVYLVARHRGLL